jgi:hypothetical protein
MGMPTLLLSTVDVTSFDLAPFAPRLAGRGLMPALAFCPMRAAGRAPG